MKKVYTLIILVFNIVITFAQTPQKMSYQAVIRNASNALVANTNVSMKISILYDNAAGFPVYTETHTAVTNANGLATLQIGGGTVEFGTFETIKWANGPYFIKTETDPTGGTNYTITATTQLLSVPYAMLAEKAVKTNYPAFKSVTNYSEYIQTVRNQWLDCPFTGISVPETGTYLVSFFGGVENNNVYDNGVTTDLDIEAEVRVFNTTSGMSMNYTLASRVYTYQRPPNFFVNYTKGLRVSTAEQYPLNAGDQLIVQYKQNPNNTALTNPWTMVPTGMHILKVRD